MNLSQQKVLIRTAPDPKPGHNRVRETVRKTVEGLTGTAPTDIRNDKNLGQLIIPKDVDERISQRMKEVPQDQAVIEYLDGTIEGANPIVDIASGVKKFERAIYILHMPQIIKKIEEGTLVTGRPIGRFVMVRHGDKQADGTLSEKGVQEAIHAGVYTKDINDGGDIPVGGVFGVQQGNVQQVMSALQIGTHWDEEEKDTQALIRENWNSLPEAWKEPYRTGEVTIFEIHISPEFNLDFYKTTSTDKKTDYIKKNLQVRIQRNGHTETYDMSALGRCEEVVKAFETK